MCTILTPTSFSDLENIDRLLSSNNGMDRFVVDLSQMVMINSIFVSTLLKFRNQIAMCNASTRVLETLNILGVDKIVAIVEDPMDIYEVV